MKGSRVVVRLGRNKDVGRLKQGVASRGGSDKELASTGASIPPIRKRQSTNQHTKYIHGDPKISTSRSCPSKTSLSQQNGCRVFFSMKFVRWLKTNGANCTVPRRKRKPPSPLPPRAFSIVNFPFFVSSYPGRYSCRLTAARLHKEICFRQSSIPNV